MNCKNEKTTTDLKVTQAKLQKAIEETLNLKKEVRSKLNQIILINESTKCLSIQKKELEENSLKNQSQSDYINDLNILLTKEKKSMQGLLVVLSKAISRDLMSVFHDIMNNIETIHKMEIDKLKLSKRLKETEKESKFDKTLNNVLLTSMLNEISNIKGFLCDLDKKIGKIIFIIQMIKDCTKHSWNRNLSKVSLKIALTEQ